MLDKWPNSRHFLVIFWTFTSCSDTVWAQFGHFLSKMCPYSHRSGAPPFEPPPITAAGLLGPDLVKTHLDSSWNFLRIDTETCSNDAPREGAHSWKHFASLSQNCGKNAEKVGAVSQESCYSTTTQTSASRWFKFKSKFPTWVTLIWILGQGRGSQETLCAPELCTCRILTPS